MTSPFVSFSQVESCLVFVLLLVSLMFLAVLNRVPVELSVYVFTACLNELNVLSKVSTIGVFPICILRMERVVVRKSALIRSFKRDLNFCSSS